MTPLPRRGSLLIIVAGLSALLMSLTLVFLVRMRSAADDGAAVLRETEAHLMLVAACNYIQETSRLGWDDTALLSPRNPALAHKEAFGWLDVRDGSDGPRDQNGNQPAGFDGSWLDYHVAAASRLAGRFPMYPMRRPPYAVLPVAAPNPIASSGARKGLPYVTNPDPLPALTSTNPARPAVPVPASSWAAFAAGDQAPLQPGGTPPWFRVYRDGAATFVVTCGSGGTLGYRDWTDVQLDHATAVFGGDRELFKALRDVESVLWYRVEWSAAVAVPDYYVIHNDFTMLAGATGAISDSYLQASFDASLGNRSQPHNVNPVGTMRYIQRLSMAPAYW